MLSESFNEIITYNIDKLKEELMMFPSEESLWQLKGDIKNSAGNMGLHIAGNLKHFIGAALGNTGYVRQRDKEFSDKNIPREKIINELNEAKEVVAKVLSSLSDEALSKEFPLETFGKGRNVHVVLVILIAHLNYHLGQINYLRRML
jgi:uncharacterized damage-inducible protein DinB